jgi:hypothetical protein
MRVIILPADGFVSIDGEGYSNINLSFIDSGIHAVQWYDTEGDIERKDSRGRMVANEHTTSIEQFQPALDLWVVAKQQALQAQSLQEQGAD